MLSQYLQDATLNWMRGQPIDPPPAVLWMSFHSDTEATAAADVSYAFGGRVRIKQENLSEPRFLDGQSAGTRQIVNIAAAVSELASADASASSFAMAPRLSMASGAARLSKSAARWRVEVMPRAAPSNAW